MKASIKNKNDGQTVPSIDGQTVPSINSQSHPSIRDFRGQNICLFVLDTVLNKSFQVLSRNANLNRLIEIEKLKQSQDFTINNCGQVLQNFFVEPSDVSPEMKHEKSLLSPSKQLHSFLNYQKLEQEKAGSNLQIKRQKWQTRRDSRKIYNCNKIYMIKRSFHNKQSQGQSTVKSIRLNDTISSVFSNGGRFSHKGDMIKMSISQKLLGRQSIKTRLTTNHMTQFQTENSRHLQNRTQVFNNSFSPNSPSSFYQHNIGAKDRDHNESQNQSKVVKLDETSTVLQSDKNSPANLFHVQQNEKQIINYISFLRQRKQKLDKIMKVFDLDQIVKKRNNIQRQMLIKDKKNGNLAQTYTKMPETTTDYEGNLIYLKDNNPNRSATHRQTIKKKKKAAMLPRFQNHIEGSLDHNVSFKVKDIDDKTKNFLNQIFSSAQGTSNKSVKKLTFKQTNHSKNSNEKSSRRQKNRSKADTIISLVGSQSRIQHEERGYQPSIRQIQTFKEDKNLRKVPSQYKTLKSVLKMSPKYYRNNVKEQRSQRNKENCFDLGGKNKQNNFSFVKNQKKQQILRSEPTNREVKWSQNSLIDLQRVYREQYNLKRQRIHPNSKKNIKLNTQQEQFAQINQASNENSQRNSIYQDENRNINNFFDILLTKAMK